MALAELAWLNRLLGIPADKLAEPGSFEYRLKVQKAVFLLRHLGMKPFTNYNFNLYLSGPYSPDLATDYYELKGVGPASVNLGDTEVKLLKWFTSHPMDWLEVASSILSIKESYPTIGDEEVYSVLHLSKPWVTETSFKRIMGELRKKALLG